MPYCLLLAILRLLEECATQELELTSIGLKASIGKPQNQEPRDKVAWVVDMLSKHAVVQS